MIVEFDHEARQEVRDAIAHYHSLEGEVASEFVVMLAEALERVAERPHAWPPIARRLRRYLMTKFPYKIVYRVEGETIRIYAFAHVKRRPGYWNKRLVRR